MNKSQHNQNIQKEDAERRMKTLHADWELINDSYLMLHRKWAFKNFKDALSFVNTVGEVSESMNHHPEISFGWGHVEIKIWTHTISGLRELDFAWAQRIDQL